MTLFRRRTRNNVDAAYVSPTIESWEVFILGFSSLTIFFSRGDSFNMQSVVPIAIALFYGYLLSSRDVVVKQTVFTNIAAVLVLCTVSLILSMIIDREIVTAKSIIRILYFYFILSYFYITVNREYSTKNIKLLIKCNLVAGTLIAIAVIVRFLGGARGKVAVANVWGVAVEENYMAALLAFCFVLAIISLRYSTSALSKTLLLISSTTILGSIILSGSRAALLAALLATALFVGYLLAFNGFKSFVWCSLALFVICISAQAVLMPLLNTIPSWYLDRFFRNTYIDSSNAHRLEFWSFGVRGFLKRPLFGYGIGNYAHYVSEHMTYYYGYRVTNDIVVSHNTFLDFLIDVGLAGSLSIWHLFATHIKRGCRNASVIALLIVSFLTALIVGGERTYFFWNAAILISIIAEHISRNSTLNNSILSIFNLA